MGASGVIALILATDLVASARTATLAVGWVFEVEQRGEEGDTPAQLVPSSKAVASSHQGRLDD